MYAITSHLVQVDALIKLENWFDAISEKVEALRTHHRGSSGADQILGSRGWVTISFMVQGILE